MQARIKEHFERLAKLPLLTSVTNKDGGNLEHGFEVAKIFLSRNDQKCWIIGNGGSAAIASHMAEDYTKNGDIPMMAFNDAAMMSCFANDFGWENVFAAAIGYYAQPDDLVIAISSSGKSQNIIRGVEAAKAKGCNVITFSGFKPDNQLRQLGDLNFYVPDDSYGNVEITHLSLLHAVLDFICDDKAKG